MHCHFKPPMAMALLFIFDFILICFSWCRFTKLFRRLIPKSAFMHFLAILTLLHIWKDKSQGYLKMQGQWQFLQNKGV